LVREEAALIAETIAFSDGDLGAYRKVRKRDKEQPARLTLARIHLKAARFTNDPFSTSLLAEGSRPQAIIASLETEAAADWPAPHQRCRTE
jgi:hypothetical protein